MIHGHPRSASSLCILFPQSIILSHFSQKLYPHFPFDSALLNSPCFLWHAEIFFLLENSMLILLTSLHTISLCNLKPGIDFIPWNMCSLVYLWLLCMLLSLHVPYFRLCTTSLFHWSLFPGVLLCPVSCSHTQPLSTWSTVKLLLLVVVNKCSSWSVHTVIKSCDKSNRGKLWDMSLSVRHQTSKRIEILHEIILGPIKAHFDPSSLCYGGEFHCAVAAQWLPLRQPWSWREGNGSR